MSLEVVRQIDVDLYENKMIYVNAKQSDGGRYILIHCYNQGSRVFLDNETITAFVRGRKFDDYEFINTAVVTSEGNVLVCLTEQILKVPGNVYADVLLHTENKYIFSTMNFRINVIPAAYDDDSIESTPEYLAFAELVGKIQAPSDAIVDEAKSYMYDADRFSLESKDYYELSKSYAVGNNGYRENDGTDNAKYYYELTFQALEHIHIATVEEAMNYITEVDTV